MHTPQRVIASVLLSLGIAGTCGPAAAGERINLVFNGLPAANVQAVPATSVFAQWCESVCFPTTQFPVHDAATGQLRGQAQVWGKNFQVESDGSLCFSEFIAFSLADGELHILSGPRGTCGAPISAKLKPPLYPERGALVVIAGGGDGDIVGGSGRYLNWTGTFTDRVFVGFGLPDSGVGGIVYYDQLWFSISRR